MSRDSGCRDEADGCFDGGGGPLDPFDGPFQDAGVVSETGPEELPRGVAAEPVDQEDPRQL